MPPGMRRPKNDVLRTNLFWELSRLLLLYYFALVHCIRFRTTCNLPRQGPLLVAPNHVSYYDPPLIAAGIPFRMRFMAWDALFRIPVIRQLCVAYGAFPVKLKSADKAAISRTLRLLRNNEGVMIFPEGERTEKGNLQPFESGVARLALQTGASVVPVSVVGGYEAWPRARLLPRWFVPITVKFHPPVRLEASQDRQEFKQQVAELNEMIARPIRRRMAAWQRLKAMRGW